MRNQESQNGKVELKKIAVNRGQQNLRREWEKRKKNRICE
jgi:hypothetical protein